MPGSASPQPGLTNAAPAGTTPYEFLPDSCSSELTGEAMGMSAATEWAGLVVCDMPLTLKAASLGPLSGELPAIPPFPSAAPLVPGACAR